MAVERRKQSIMEHLARSTSNLNLVRLPQTLEASRVSSRTDAEKARIMDHLSRSAGQSNVVGFASQQRKQKVLNHAQITRG
ncbi:MAG: hypothetical protein HC890_01350 [Chloroflexaceae bacterium]|nr:hypothetical protein [Chloroflexaceae bacterium]